MIASDERRAEAVRIRKRNHMRRVLADPERRDAINARRRELYPENRAESQRAYFANLREKHFFVWRARLWSARHRVKVTAWDLASLWRAQRGVCALSGIKLGRNAELDHIIPVAKAGAHTAQNLRWLDPRVNYARRDMDDADFVAVCRSVVQRNGVA